MNIDEIFKCTQRDCSNGRFKPKGNVFVKNNGCIYCFSLNGDLLFFTDEEFSPEIIKHNWCKTADGYSATCINTRQVSTHRFILKASKCDLVDHINGNKKDNRLCNLRICNKSQNAYNSKINTNNTSGHTGVYFRKDTQKWVATIKNNNRNISLGCFKDKSDAIKAREEAEKRIIGEFRRINER